ncbi:hypothetical protein [Desulfoferula mesophila]|uniref:Uncharacterized protein n=1 Tax=Desulfoferula mesophila TaxID=3058419 RepID=A0AAU9ER25_9BACT|nr:hypothetical protein FAK_01370 [Desulfoferula mesophilus]
MKYKSLAITAGVAAALTMGLYLGAGAQGANCTIGGETGPGVPVLLAAQSDAKTKPAQPAAEQPKDAKPAPAAAQAPDKDKKDAKPAQPAGAAPIVPIIAPDEGC